MDDNLNPLTRPLTEPLLDKDGAILAVTPKRGCELCGRVLGDATEEEIATIRAGGALGPVVEECGCLNLPSPDLEPEPGEAVEREPENPRERLRRLSDARQKAQNAAKWAEDEYDAALAQFPLPTEHGAYHDRFARLWYIPREVKMTPIVGLTPLFLTGAGDAGTRLSPSRFAPFVKLEEPS